MFLDLKHSVSKDSFQLLNLSEQKSCQSAKIDSNKCQTYQKSKMT